MAEFSRRDIAKMLGAAGALAAMQPFGRPAFAQGAGKVVIIGGGAGGATVAHYVKKGAPQLDVTLVEVNPQYTSCFYSNLYLGGYRSLESITHSYDTIKALGIKVVNAYATDVDNAGKTVTLQGGDKLSYDKLVLSPGIDLKYDAIEGYTPEAAEIMPHSWKAGAQTALLRRQLLDMPDGGLVVMAAPGNPYRCPPGPYERASMIAQMIKFYKPKSKLILLDAKDKFSKQGLFQEGWDKHYPGIVEWYGKTSELQDGTAARVDIKTMEVVTKDGRKEKAAVANIIPPQRAGIIATKAGATQGDWCPINAEDFSSTLVRDVYVLGDASVAAPMPKSAFTANSQAKVVANAVLSELAGAKKFPARYRNTCWSLIATDDGVKIGGSYQSDAGKVVETSSFVSKTGEDATLRADTYKESIGWYDGIVADMFAKT